MALLEDLFGLELEGAAGPVALGVGALLLVPAVLPAVGNVLRPVAKQLIKTGISVYDQASQGISGAYEAAGDLVAEARAEREAEIEPHGQERRGKTPHIERGASPQPT